MSYLKTALVYLHVVGKSDPTSPPPDHYLPWSLRFIETYRTFKGKAPHDLVVVHCGGPVQDMPMFREAEEQFCYLGSGWDIGAHQYAAMILNDYDFLICAATPIYFRQCGFIETILAARNAYGDGLFGPMASYEHRPHIRTCCWACSPKTFLQYPILVDNRDKTFKAESGENSITNWYLDQGYPVIMVAADGFYERHQWRTPPNIFRRGDQSNCLVWDRHADIYDAANLEERQTLERLADGVHENATFHRNPETVQR